VASETDQPLDTGDHGKMGLTRRTLMVGGLTLLGSAATAGLAYRLGADRTKNRSNTKRERFRAQPDALFRIRTPHKYVGLTFDDGPDIRYTPGVLDLLRDRQLTATFFLIGVNVERHKGLAQRAVAEGHTIGNHTYDHQDLDLLTAEQVEAEIDRGARAIVAAGLPKPTWFRPPKGYTDEVVGIIADAKKYRTVFWDVAVEHFVDHLEPTQPIQHGIDELLDKVQPGSIILAHDGGRVIGTNRPVVNRSKTIAALPLLLDGLAARGYEAMSIDDLVARA
jgi:peptidoglycan-N-acetylglucosamine deacetylase